MQPAVARDAQSRNPPPSERHSGAEHATTLGMHTLQGLFLPRHSLLLHSGIKITRELAQLLPMRPGNALGLGMEMEVGMGTGTVAGYAGRQIAGSSANETGNHMHQHIITHTRTHCASPLCVECGRADAQSVRRDE